MILELFLHRAHTLFPRHFDRNVKNYIYIPSSINDEPQPHWRFCFDTMQFIAEQERQIYLLSFIKGFFLVGCIINLATFIWNRATLGVFCSLIIQQQFFSLACPFQVFLLFFLLALDSVRRAAAFHRIRDVLPFSLCIILSLRKQLVAFILHPLLMKFGCIYMQMTYLNSPMDSVQNAY